MHTLWRRDVRREVVKMLLVYHCYPASGLQRHKHRTKKSNDHPLAIEYKRSDFRRGFPGTHMPPCPAKESLQYVILIYGEVGRLQTCVGFVWFGFLVNSIMLMKSRKDQMLWSVYKYKRRKPL